MARCGFISVPISPLWVALNVCTSSEAVTPGKRTFAFNLSFTGDADLKTSRTRDECLHVFEES